MKTYIYLVIMISLVSCGPKVTKNSEAVLTETEKYISNIDGDNSLKTKITEGALTDTEGFKDIGKFKTTAFFNGNTNHLYKIVNVETTDKTITEHYYFKNNKLSYFSSSSGNSALKKLYLSNGKIVSATNINSKEQKLFLAKAKRFHEEFKKNH